MRAKMFAKMMNLYECTDAEFKNEFARVYTESLRFHTYISIGQVDSNEYYEPPACMMKSAYRNAFAIFKMEQEQANMNEAEAPGACYFMRKEEYKFSNDEDNTSDSVKSVDLLS